MISKFLRRDARERARSICEELRANASDLIDGECDEELIRRLESHLAECTDCDSWTASLRSTIELLKGMPTEEMPAQLQEKIRQLTTDAR